MSLKTPGSEPVTQIQTFNNEEHQHGGSSVGAGRAPSLVWETRQTAQCLSSCPGRGQALLSCQPTSTLEFWEARNSILILIRKI